MTPLKMGIINFLSRIKKIFYSILSLCSLPWNPFFWYKFTWRLLLLVSEEIMTVLSFGPKSSTEEKTHNLSLKLEELNSGDEELKDNLQSIQDVNTTSISRLYTFEEKVENLKTDLSGEKELWRTKFQELLIEQQSIKEQQHKYVHLEEIRRSENLMPQNADAIPGVVESNVDVGDGLHRRFGEQVKSAYGRNRPFMNEYDSLEGPSSLKFTSLPMGYSSVNYLDGNAQKASKCFRVFVPRSPLDLNIGNKVKILLPSGKVGTGVIYKMEHQPDKSELQVGVDLESQECWHHFSRFKAQYKLHRMLTD
ncbi:hypothetical protein GDO81_005955 [Engystomops pustulosus]|uniref:Uncharacterized protein n=1 Tax=Engystomops pustulosus TaxID=76066 RepID=A0AAV7CUH3_ENGPU|nr:hypothetical protein GDO81_005955 [Engystomops pustulosus]